MKKFKVEYKRGQTIILESISKECLETELMTNIRATLTITGIASVPSQDIKSITELEDNQLVN